MFTLSPPTAGAQSAVDKKPDGNGLSPGIEQFETMWLPCGRVYLPYATSSGSASMSAELSVDAARIYMYVWEQVSLDVSQGNQRPSFELYLISR